MRDLDAVLFDLDGTLVETNIDFALMREEMLGVAGEFGVAPESARAMDILAIVEYVCDTLNARGLPERADEARREAMRRLERIELFHSETAREVESAQALIAALRDRGVKVGIVTRNCRRASEISLEASGLGVGFLMLSREDVRNTKPHPDHLMRALEILDARPDRSLMVGDHTMDVEAGKAAGMRTIGLLAPERPRDFFRKVEPDEVVESLREIVDAFVDLDS
ncbi:MAG: HAD-IA family hydrolase [Armatimonadota bacterium]|nr:HAD-IA family hydrolase [Armatimonadota bacterium]